MSLIHTQNLNKYFKVLNRREGLGGMFQDLFSGDFKTVERSHPPSFTSPTSLALDSLPSLIGFGRKASIPTLEQDHNQWT